MTEERNPKLDQLEGKAKEIIGKVTDDKALEAEGKGQEISGKIKEGINDITKGIKGFFDKKDDNEQA